MDARAPGSLTGWDSRGCVWIAPAAAAAAVLLWLLLLFRPRRL